MKTIQHHLVETQAEYLVFCVAKIANEIRKDSNMYQLWIGFAKTRKSMNPYIWSISDAPKSRPYTLKDIQELFVLLNRFLLEKNLILAEYFRERAAKLFLMIQENQKTFNDEAIKGFFLAEVFPDTDIAPIDTSDWYEKL